MVTITSSEFRRNVSAAKRPAAQGPVVITDRGQPTFVLLSIDEYLQLAGDGESLVERLSMEDDVDIEFEPAKICLSEPEL